MAAGWKELFYRARPPSGKLMAVGIKSGANLGANLDVGVPKALFDAPGWFDVTADGQRFIVVMPVEQAQARSPITVVLNWQAGLKK